jgi:glucosamine--fructose-6-phosphate aminotransferase (isomerizing)
MRIWSRRSGPSPQLDKAFHAGLVHAGGRAGRGSSLFVIARGFGLAVAQEAALKLKETSSLHGEAFSSAEVRHGPMAVVREGFPVIAFASEDAAGDDVRALCADFAARGARVWLADSTGATRTGVTSLPALSERAELAPLLMIASFIAWPMPCRWHAATIQTSRPIWPR